MKALKTSRGIISMEWAQQKAILPAEFLFQYVREYQRRLKDFTDYQQLPNWKKLLAPKKQKPEILDSVFEVKIDTSTCIPEITGSDSISAIFEVTFMDKFLEEVGELTSDLVYQLIWKPQRAPRSNSYTLRFGTEEFSINRLEKFIIEIENTIHNGAQKIEDDPNILSHDLTRIEQEFRTLNLSPQARQLEYVLERFQKIQRSINEYSGKVTKVIAEGNILQPLKTRNGSIIDMKDPIAEEIATTYENLPLVVDSFTTYFTELLERMKNIEQVYEETLKNIEMRLERRNKEAL